MKIWNRILTSFIDRNTTYVARNDRVISIYSFSHIAFFAPYHARNARDDDSSAFHSFFFSLFLLLVYFFPFLFILILWPFRSWIRIRSLCWISSLFHGKMPRYIHHFQFPRTCEAGLFFCPFSQMPRMQDALPTCASPFLLSHSLSYGKFTRVKELWRRRKEKKRIKWCAYYTYLYVCMYVRVWEFDGGALYPRRYMRFLHIRLCGKINFAQLSLLIKMSRFTFIFTCKEIITLNWTCFFHYMKEKKTFHISEQEKIAFEIENTNAYFMRMCRVNTRQITNMSPYVHGQSHNSNIYTIMSKMKEKMKNFIDGTLK